MEERRGEERRELNSKKGEKIKEKSRGELDEEKRKVTGKG